MNTRKLTTIFSNQKEELFSRRGAEHQGLAAVRQPAEKGDERDKTTDRAGTHDEVCRFSSFQELS